MAKKQRAVVFAEGGKKNTFVISGPDAVEEARALVRSVGGTYHLEGFTAVEQAAIHLEGFKPAREKHFRAHMTDDDLEEIERNERATCECCAPGAHAADCARAAAHRKGNPHHLEDARDALTRAFGRPTGGNADWQESAWFVQGSGGKVNPNRPDVHPGRYATKSVWVVEQPEESEYCVILRDIDDEAGETIDTELMCGSVAGIHGVIDGARAYAAEILGRKGRKGNPTSKKMPQFGSSVTPALQGLVRDVTGKACYQETCFVSDGAGGRRRPRG